MGRLVQQPPLLEPIGHIPPAKAEARFDELDAAAMGRIGLEPTSLRNPERFSSSSVEARTPG